MLIGIDGNEANISHRVGVGRYAIEILRHLYKNQKSTFKIYLKKPPNNDLPKRTSGWQYMIVGPKPFWTQLGLPTVLFWQHPRPDVFFTPSHYAPRFSPCPRVISIMDLSFLYFPEMFKRTDLYQLKFWTDYSIKKAAKIITISEHTKNDIIRAYNIQGERIVVTYPGYDREKFQMTNDKLQIRKIKNKYNIRDDYILYVGTLQPRKNISRLIEAFRLLRNDKLQLVVAGRKGWLYEEIFQRARELKISRRLVFTGFVEDNDLPFLYQGARCFVLPSLYEGFGLTAVEAMACGCPTVLSKVSSLAEVADQATILVDPYSTESIARGICTILTNHNLSNKLIQKALERVRMFSWENCAQQTYSVLANLAYGNV